MDIAGEGDCVITTWDGLIHSGLGGMSSRTGGFIGNGCLAIGLVMVTRRGSDKDEKKLGWIITGGDSSV